MTTLLHLIKNRLILLCCHSFTFVSNYNFKTKTKGVKINLVYICKAWLATLSGYISCHIHSYKYIALILSTEYKKLIPLYSQTLTLLDKGSVHVLLSEAYICIA